jgi:phosphoribosyl 1,2-cyclic phosphodiesterase
VLRAGRSAVLLDAGFGPRSVATKMSGLGVTVGDLDAIVLTHLDHDHFRPTWFKAMNKLGIRLYCHRRHLHELYQHKVTTAGELDARAMHRAGLLHVIEDQPFTIALRDGTMLGVTPLPLAHDREGTVGYRIDGAKAALGYATDLGRVPARLVEMFTDTDLLALECNYDPPMQMASARPAMLKRRIMGGSGHLSNQQAFEAVCQIISRSRRLPRHVVLLHLSRQCNCPRVVQTLFDGNPHLRSRLCISTQLTPTRWLSAFDDHEPGEGEQLMMFG